MKKAPLLSLLFLISLSAFSQVQIGEDIDGERPNDQSGWSVSLSGDGTIVAIGARANTGAGTWAGHTRIYQNKNGSWVQLGQDINGEAQYDQFGWSVSLSKDGEVVAVGAIGNDGNGSFSGHTRVYKYDTGAWIQLGADIDGEAAGDHSGGSVSLSADGSVVAIGATGNDSNGNNSGHVRIYEYTSGNWVQIGDDIEGQNAEDFSGKSVSLSSDGRIVAIGANENDDNGNNSGQTRIFQYKSGLWTQLGADINGEYADDESGIEVNLSSDGQVVAIGAIYNQENGTSSGHVRVYKYNSGNWIQMGSDIDGEAAGDRSGGAISLSSDGTILAIGASGNDGTTLSMGHTRVYKYVQNKWIQIGGDIDGEKGDDYSGVSVSLSSDGTKIAIGAHGNDGNGSSAGHVRVFQLDLSVGADEIYKNEFSFYPNPLSDQITIEVESNMLGLKYHVIDQFGRELKIGVMNATTVKIDLSSLPKGFFFLRIGENSKAVKLIVE
jgi:hypothetical protein